MRKILYDKVMNSDREDLRKINITPKKAEELFVKIAEKTPPLMGEKFILDEINHEIISQLILYFINNEGFRGDLRKGLFIHGEPGSGKTFAMRVFGKFCQIIGNKTFRSLTPIEIQYGYQSQGSDFILRYKKGNLLIDDLMESPQECAHYGAKSFPIKDLLYLRYDEFVNRGVITHITTNLGGKGVSDNYGDRIRSRFTEIFNDIILTGKDRRK